MSKNYVLVSGLVFGVVALAQVARAIAQVPVLIGSFDVPVIVSWIAAAVAAGLCYWAFQSRS